MENTLLICSSRATPVYQSISKLISGQINLCSYILYALFYVYWAVTYEIHTPRMEEITVISQTGLQ